MEPLPRPPSRTDSSRGEAFKVPTLMISLPLQRAERARSRPRSTRVQI